MRRFLYVWNQTPDAAIAVSVGVAIGVLALFLLAACSSATFHAGWCAYHIARFAADIHHHSHGWALLQAALAAHHCSRI